MKNAISWFVIPTPQLDAAQTFYEAVLGRPMRRESMGPSEGAVFAYDKKGDGMGGADDGSSICAVAAIAPLQAIAHAAGSACYF